MPELSPVVFSLVVVAVLAATIVVPRMRNRSEKQSLQDQLIGTSVPQTQQHPARTQPGAAPVGAPRAPSPVATGDASTDGNPEALKLPVYR
ncbi:MAG: hypothetical protein QM648_07690 [Solirubrobacterales bacterium]